MAFLAQVRDLSFDILLYLFKRKGANRAPTVLFMGFTLSAGDKKNSDHYKVGIDNFDPHFFINTFLTDSIAYDILKEIRLERPDRRERDNA